MINPDQLVGLKQACFVMDSLVNHHSEEEIAQKLGGDAQLVRMWILFLQHNHWMTETNGVWTVTEKGLMWQGKVSLSYSAIDGVLAQHRKSILHHRTNKATLTPKD